MPRAPRIPYSNEAAKTLRADPTAGLTCRDTGGGLTSIGLSSEAMGDMFALAERSHQMRSR